jgi:hypothetical protein
MGLKSERLKKLEAELEDLEKWMSLGLVPKKDFEKHRDEMQTLKGRIDEEKERLRFMKESGEAEEYTAPKKNAHRVYAEPHTLPDIDVSSETDAGLDMDTESYDTETTSEEETESPQDEDKTILEEEEAEEEDDPFSDRNRWRRGVLEDPDSENW